MVLEDKTNNKLSNAEKGQEEEEEEDTSSVFDSIVDIVLEDDEPDQKFPLVRTTSFSFKRRQNPIKSIGILTSGGDAPGMNAALRSVVRVGINGGLIVKFIRDGYSGLVNPYPFGKDGICRIERATLRSVGAIIHKGGTIIGTSRCKSFRTKEGRKKAHNNLQKFNIDALIVIGGDGSFRGAKVLSDEYDIPIIGIPGTIDNDISGTDYTIGFDTAVNTAVECIDKIKDTAQSHNRLFVVEVMGRDSGAIALQSGICCGAEAIIIPEVPLKIDLLVDHLCNGIKRGKHTVFIIILSEGAGLKTKNDLFCKLMVFYYYFLR